MIGHFKKLSINIFSFKVIKILIFILAIATCINMFYLCYFLRPLNWDGARFSFYLIHYGKPFYDSENYRILASLFQLPTIFVQKIWKPSSPLFLVRLYFFTLVMPIYSYLTYRILKSSKISDLVIVSSLMFIVFLPAMSFTINVMFETLFFYFLAFETILEKKYGKSIFFLLLSALGHPSIIIGLILFVGVQLYFLKKEKSKILQCTLISTIVLLIVNIYRLQHAITFDPKSKYFFPDVIKNVIANYSHPSTFSMYVGIWFFIISFLLLIFVSDKYKKIIFTMGILILTFYILKSLDANTLYSSSHGYRVFSLFFTIGIVAFMLYESIKNSSNNKAMFKISILILIIGVWHLGRDLQINLSQRQLNLKLESRFDKKTNCIIHSDIKLSYFSPSSISILKLFLDNNWSVGTIHYVPQDGEGIQKESLLCNELSSSFIPLDFQLLDHGKINKSSFYGLYLNEKGNFKLSF